MNVKGLDSSLEGGKGGTQWATKYYIQNVRVSFYG